MQQTLSFGRRSSMRWNLRLLPDLWRLPAFIPPAFQERSVSWQRAALMIVALAAIATLDRRSEFAGILPQTAISAVAWTAIVSLLWAVLLRLLDLEQQRWPAVVATLGDFVGIAFLLSAGGTYFLPFAALLPIKTVTTGIRFGQGPFYLALATSLCIARLFLLAPAVDLAARWVFAVSLLIALPLIVNRVIRTLTAESSAAISARDSQRQFIGMISHELRSPLHVVINAAQLIDRKHIKDQDQALLDSVHHSGQTLLNMVNDLLDVAAASAGKIELKMVEFRIHHLVARINDVLEIAANAKNVRLSWSVDEKIPGLRGSKRHIEQVVTNLATNAIKYTPAGGKVHVSVHHYYLDRKSKGAPKTVTLVFAISDTGHGLKDADKKRIFEPFQQISQGAARQHEGVGLGLHVVKTISDKMNGVIDVQDNPGGGTIFTWHVDVGVSDIDIQPSPVSALALLDEHRASVRPLRCLVIDDNQTNRDILTQILLRSGHHPETRPDGASGLTALRTLPFDLVFLDLHMPGVSGWDVLEEIAADPAAHTYPPIVVLSAVTDQQTASEVVSKGAVAYLTKPLAIEAVLDLLKRHAGSQSIHARSIPLSNDAPLALIAQTAPERVQEYLRSILSDIRMYEARFSASVIDRDRSTAIAAVASLRTSCESAGSGGLADDCQSLSEALRDGAGLEQSLLRFNAISSQLRGTLQSYAPGRPAGSENSVLH